LGIPDFASMLKNLAYSMVNVEKLLFGSMYLVGLGVLVAGVYGLASFGMGPHADQDKKKQAIFKVVVGTVLIFLPTSLSVMNVTIFGQGANLSYQTYNGITIYDAVKILVQVGGITWFSHGVLLILKQEQTGREKSFKALLYIVAGTCALNFDYFVIAVGTILNSVMNYFKSLI
jgi:intracellular multiplication protein IcmC